MLILHSPPYLTIHCAPLHTSLPSLSTARSQRKHTKGTPHRDHRPNPHNQSPVLNSLRPIEPRRRTLTLGGTSTPRRARSTFTRGASRRIRPRSANSVQQTRTGTRRSRRLHRRHPAKRAGGAALPVTEVVLIRNPRELILRVAAAVTAISAGCGVARNAVAKVLISAADEIEHIGVILLVCGFDVALQPRDHARAEFAVGAGG